MFLDASVIVAVLAEEPDAESLLATIQTSPTRFRYSPLSLFEAATGLARARSANDRVRPEAISEALGSVTDFLTALDAEEIPISSAIARRAIDAAQRYGRAVGHPARLNLGDCFAYACARAADIPLLYKGDDFARTDLA